MGSELVNDKRNYAVDVLRIVSMFMIVCLHICSHGSLDSFFGLGSVNGVALKFIRTLCMVAVNVYVLISGYYLSAQKFRLSRLFKLLIEVLFYAWLFFVLAFIRREPMGAEEIMKSVLPVSYKLYWFVTAYIGMSLLSPLLNKLLSLLDKTKHLMLVIGSLVLASLLRDLLYNSDPYGLEGGYSLIWFLVVYILASYLRHHFDPDRIKHPALIYFGLCVIMMASWVLMELVKSKITFLARFDISENLMSYNSLLNISASVMLFLAFLKRNVKNHALCKIIGVISPLTLGVYLIHDNLWMRGVIWGELAKTETFQDNVWLIPLFFVTVCAVFAACLVADYLRTLLFHTFDRTKWYKKLLSRIDAFPDRVYMKLSGKEKNE